MINKTRSILEKRELVTLYENQLLTNINSGERPTSLKQFCSRNNIKSQGSLHDWRKKFSKGEYESSLHSDDAPSSDTSEVLLHSVDEEYNIVEHLRALVSSSNSAGFNLLIKCICVERVVLSIVCLEKN